MKQFGLNKEDDVTYRERVNRDNVKRYPDRGTLTGEAGWIGNRPPLHENGLPKISPIIFAGVLRSHHHGFGTRESGRKSRFVNSDPG